MKKNEDGGTMGVNHVVEFGVLFFSFKSRC